MKYQEIERPPDNFIQYIPISDLPSSKRDLSFSIKDFSKCKVLEDYSLNFKHEFLKEVFVFDFFYNNNNAEIKIGFRLIFQSNHSTITENQVNNIMSHIIDYSKTIDGISIPGLN